MQIKVNNYLVDIIANMKKEGDFAASMEIAERMVEDASGDLVMVEWDDCEGWIVLSSKGGYKQRAEWLDLYKDAKAAL